MKTLKTVTAEQAMIRLETLCARAERCTRELRDKLWQWQIPSVEADRIIASLEERRFVDDTRFARSYINDKVRFARWGPRKIAAALATKRIDSATVRTLIAEIDSDLLEDNLKDLLAAKARTMKDPFTYEGRTKLYRFGISRGYSPEMVGRQIRADFRGQEHENE